MKYVYGLTRDIESIEDLPAGLGGMKVYPVFFGGIAAWVSDLGAASLPGNAQNALVHQSVVEEAFRRSTSLIPCRFGALFADEEEVRSLLKRHRARLEGELSRLEGRLEVSIRAIFNGSDLPGSMGHSQPRAPEGLTEAARYLLGKKQRFDAVKELSGKAEQFNQELNEATAPFWAEVRVQKRPIDPGLLLSLYYLVDGEKLSAFKCAYQQFKGKWPSLKLLYTGPWPPYSFADFNLRDRP